MNTSNFPKILVFKFSRKGYQIRLRLHQRASGSPVLSRPSGGPWTPAEGTSRFALVMSRFPCIISLPAWHLCHRRGSRGGIQRLQANFALVELVPLPPFCEIRDPPLTHYKVYRIYTILKAIRLKYHSKTQVSRALIMVTQHHLKLVTNEIILI